MFGFGKVCEIVYQAHQQSNGKKTKDVTTNVAELSIYEDGRDKYWGLENVGD